MSEIGNQPAYPHAVECHGDGFGSVERFYGLTKREHFAALAMQGYCAREGSIECDAETIAYDAVRLADALLAALKE